MQYRKFGNGLRRVLFGSALCFLCLSSWQLSAQSSSVSGSVVKTFTAEQWAVIQADYQALSKTLADLQATNKQQADKISNLETQLTLASLLQKELQATIDSQAGKLTALNLNLTSSAKTLESSETWKIIGWTVGGISILANIGQAIAYQVK